MAKFELDFDTLDQVVMPKPAERLPVKGNENRMVRVAFDLFRLDGSNREDLWVVQADDDGNEFLVRTYDLPEEEEFSKNASWEAHLDKKCANLTLAFEGTPVKRFALAQFGVKSTEDASIFKSAVLNKVAMDGDFANLLLKDFPMRGRGGRPMDGSGPRCCRSGEPMDLPSMFPEGNAIVIIDSEPKSFGPDEIIEPAKEEKKSSKEKSPSEDYDDPNDWWDNLSDDDKEELFKKFEDVPSITKEQALKLTKLEKKLATKK
jgi:hypothetical protein